MHNNTSLNDTMSSSSTPLVYNGQKTLSPGSSNVTINTPVVPDRRFQHYFVEQVGKLHLEEGVEEIGEDAFSMCWTLGNVRMPLSLSKVQKNAFAHCMLHLRSVELPPKRIQIGDRAFQGCVRLRNVALQKDDPSAKNLGKHLFKGCHNLAVLFQDSKSMVQALTTRFDGLPLHEVSYYQSYYSTNECLQKLETATAESSSDSSKRRRRQDCLGMTPLHILTFSKTAQRLELYQWCVENCLDDLVTKDEWGSLPIHYALENNLPLPIVEFLLEQHQKYHPNQPMFFDQFLLNQGVGFLQAASLPLVQLVLGFHEKHCLEPLDWDRLLHDAISMSSLDVFRCVVQRSISPRVKALEWQPWRDDIELNINAISNESLQGECWTPMQQVPPSGIDVVEKIQSKLATYERRTNMMLLELICWKCRTMAATTTPMNEQNCEEKKNSDYEDIRTNSRIHSGAEYIVPLVLSFLQ
ncbi:unnamed protein product [Cylindrotheca closterium]|uniref:Uncharacterized protein n=1 Tax=Cylindrotheca closterium TaxID=2856 RepID=A0AAD2CRX8_9STRA|nr:unnamed protein product [Cylindrotheca closterium]